MNISPLSLVICILFFLALASAVVWFVRSRGTRKS